MKERFASFLNQLNDRDRLMLLVGGVVCFIYLFYALLFSPLSNRVQHHQKQLMEDKATLIWMNKVRPQAHPERKAAEKIDCAQLLTILSDKLKETQFKHYTYQLQQSGTHEIQLSYEEVPYNLVMNWLSTLSRTYVFSIKQLQLQKTEKPGVVKMTLIIEVTPA